METYKRIKKTTSQNQQNSSVVESQQAKLSDKRASKSI
jgi:hypothetical protein